MEARKMSNTTRFFALLDGKRGAYGVTFPDLAGCTAMGDTVEAALRNAADAAYEWSEATGKTPRPRPFEALRADPEVKRALAQGASFVTVPIIRESGRAAKANISMDAGTLAAIDDAAEAHGLTRSAFIASAALEKIQRGT
jgi:predicted RNase H-like HicB family nuclease